MQTASNALRIDNVEHVAALVAAVSFKPVNLLINAPFITVSEAAVPCGPVGSAWEEPARAPPGLDSFRPLTRPG